MDIKTNLPLLYPLRYHVDHLAYRSLSTQSASLQAIKFFYEFWLQKYGTTFCYSFYTSGHNPIVAIEEMAAFYQYLVSGRLIPSNAYALPLEIKTSGFTNAARIRAVIRFIAFLINTYISPSYQDGTPKELSRQAARLHTRLMICKDSYRSLTRHSHPISAQNFQSMSMEMVISLYKIIIPCSQQKNNPRNPFPQGFIQFRNYLIVRLLLNYGLRVGELLLLECRSIKSNIQGDKFSLIITMLDDNVDSRKYAPSLKNTYSNRILELDKQDYDLLNIYIQKIRPKTNTHNFIFTSSQNGENPLSYNAVHAIFSEIDIAFSRFNPEYKSSDYYDSLRKLTPHVTRHTWAYLTLRKIYISKYKRIRGGDSFSIMDLSTFGLMTEAKDELRLLGGWSLKSQMPDVYAKRFLSEQANAANIHRVQADNAEFTHLLQGWINDYEKP